MRTYSTKILACLFTLIGISRAAENVDSLVVSFSNPSLPGTVKSEMMMGSIKVRTHSGKDVIILSKEGDGTGLPALPALPVINFDTDLLVVEDEELSEIAAEKPDPEKIKGLQKIQSSQFGINVEEKDNTIQINMPAMALLGHSGGELELVVPKKTSLQLKSMAGQIQIDDVTGEIDVEAMGGSINLNGVGGTITAHTMRNIEATVTEVAPDKPMSFSTFSGDIDVALPANIKATFKLKSHGDIYTDFDTSKRKMSKNVSEEKKQEGYEAQIEKLLEIPVNGGGLSIEFTNFSGNIYIRKLK